ncbi:hypothetical protein J8L88_17565 [Aquimarina sp. MMG015]|uniref:hypothetical protein n=1 Tax=Aquimarina sp. MMG015 TaxID=2822689 RepID=UPI001B3A6776|nr:hypothetical protein [Aquimarina sp. MMG015]MBQ4804674.1 hypothetical protein [Aquimarina sp. MMG015]
MKISIDIKYLMFITLGFVLFTIIGTVSHEFGHILIAKSLGYQTTLHYGSMSYDNSDFKKKIVEIYNQNKIEIDQGTDFVDKKEYEEGVKKLTNDILLVRMGGPLQTTVTGIVGLMIICWRRKKSNDYQLKFLDWLAIFLSLFWLREVFNLTMSIGSELIKPDGSYFGGDEKKISELLNLWNGTVSFSLGIIGLLVTMFVLLKVVPKQLRFTFILGGFLGGVFGFIFWMNILGPEILP